MHVNSRGCNFVLEKRNRENPRTMHWGGVIEIRGVIILKFA